MTWIEWLQLYVILGCLFSLTSVLVTGNIRRPVVLIILALGWPYFFYLGFIRKGK